ncbi:MAG: glycosyltransferase [Defluviitaleaceae bacterium]|nr:glycosyltransferase [Defluviitaleaceae bacterium]
MNDLAYGLLLPEMRKNNKIFHQIKKVSIVIPVYNTRIDLLSKCLDSCLTQSMAAKEYEIIIVDDGSNNIETLNLTKRYTSIHKERINYRILPKNRGASIARNTGIDISVGEYIFFVDSDDFIGKEALERMYNLGKSNNADLINGRFENAGLNRWVPKSGDVDIGLTRPTDPQLIQISNSCRMFRREAILEQGLRFDPKLKSGQDSLFVFSFIANVTRISFLNSYPCYYAVGHDAEHLHFTKLSLDEYIYFFETAFKNIYASSVLSASDLHNIASVRFASLFSRFNKDLFNDDVTETDKVKVFKRLVKAVKNVLPTSVDVHVSGLASMKLMALRANSFQAYMETDRLDTFRTKSIIKDSQSRFLFYLLKIRENLDKYIIVIVSSKTIVAENYKSYSPKPLLKTMKYIFGLKTNLDELHGYGYIAVIGDKIGSKEFISVDTKTPVLHILKLKNNNINITSVPLNIASTDIKSSVIINKKNYIVGSRGLHFVVLDSENGTVVESCNYDTTLSNVNFIMG